MATSLISGARSAAYKAPKTKISGLGSALAKQGFATAGGGGGGSSTPGYQAARQNYSSPFAATAPGYAGLIGGDWEVIGAEGSMAAQLSRAKAQYRQNLNQALIDLGVGDMGQLGKFGEYIDQDTIAKASSNKYSTMARITQEATGRKAKSNAELAARGILTSGQTTENLENITEAAEAGRYDAMRNFLSASEAGLTSLGDLEFQLADDVRKAREAAARRAAETYPELGEGTSGSASGLLGGALGDALRGATGGGGAKAGFTQSAGGGYMTQAEFYKRNPGGNYKAYIDYLRKKRGGTL